MRDLLAQRKLVVVPPVVEVIPVHVRSRNVAVEVRHIEVAIVVANDYTQNHLCHHPLKFFRQSQS
jgi:hypothetical protein